MKKILVALLTIAMMLSMAVSVFAADEGSKTADVTYEVTQTFEWSVPSSATTISTSDTDMTVSVTKNVIGYGKNLKITVAGANDNSGKHYVVDQATGASSNKLEYTITGLTDGNVLKVAAGTNTGSNTLKVKLSAAGTIAGTYKDTLTFTATVE